MTRAKLNPDLEAELAAIAEEQGCELLRIERRGDLLRLVLDHSESVSLEHCEAVSKRASALLDVEDYGTRRYTLEVTSPGLDRPLLRPVDWERACGELVRIQRHSPNHEGVETLVGRLQAFDPTDGGTATVVELDRAQGELLPLAEVKSARLEVDF